MIQNPVKTAEKCTGCPTIVRSGIWLVTRPWVFSSVEEQFIRDTRAGGRAVPGYVWFRIRMTQ